MSRPLFCHWQKDIASEIENKRQDAIAALGLDLEKTIPIFDEATQTAAASLNVPICCLGILIEEEYKIKSAYGLSHLGLMNDLAISRKIPRQDAFATYVIDSSNYLTINNTLTDSFFSYSLLASQYGIVAYLGVPIITETGECIGCLEIIDTKPRQFIQTEINFLMITARWCLAEYERSMIKNSLHLNFDKKETKNKSQKDFPETECTSSTDELAIKPTPNSEKYIRELSFQLLNQLIQKLSIPLTSIIGMSSVLKQGIYGQLNSKQAEYLQIIYDSGQEMSILVDEITKLGKVKSEVNLEYVPVDLENLGTQVLQSLESPAQNKEHTLRLSIEPGKKIWNLDREKAKKTLYYLVNTIIEGSRSGGEIHLHISHRGDILKISCRVNHPWLGEGISLEKIGLYEEVLNNKELSSNLIGDEDHLNPENTNLSNLDYDLVCLSFSAYLANLQGGSIYLQGSVESGYRFILSLPISPMD